MLLDLFLFLIYLAVMLEMFKRTHDKMSGLILLATVMMLMHLFIAPHLPPV